MKELESVEKIEAYVKDLKKQIEIRDQMIELYRQKEKIDAIYIDNLQNRRYFTKHFWWE